MLPIQAILGHAISRGFGPNDEIDFTIEKMKQEICFVGRNSRLE